MPPPFPFVVVLPITLPPSIVTVLLSSAQMPPPLPVALFSVMVLLSIVTLPPLVLTLLVYTPPPFLAVLPVKVTPLPS